MKNRILPFIVALSALSVSGSAAFYSVFGLSKLFAGASTEVIIMAGSLEFAKLVTASLLYQYWSTINKGLRTYLTIAVFVLMTITSGGIYGYLSSAYQKTAGLADVQTLTLETLDNRIENYEKQKSSREETAKTIQDRISQLNEGLNNIEYSWVDRDGAGDQREVISNQLEIANEEYSRISNDILDLDSTIFALQNEKFETETNSEVAAELGPLIYLSELTGWEMNIVVNYFLLLIVFVFDPLAIALVIAANFAFSQINGKKPNQPKVTEEDIKPYNPTEEELNSLQQILNNIKPLDKKEDEPIKPKQEELDKLDEVLKNIPTSELQNEKINPTEEELSKLETFLNESLDKKKAGTNEDVQDELTSSEDKDNQRIDVIGQNGNIGLHYDNDTKDDKEETVDLFSFIKDMNKLDDETEQIRKNISDSVLSGNTKKVLKYTK